MIAAPIASYCWAHEIHYLEASCVACDQRIPALPHPHAADLTDLNPRWAAAVAREEAARCTCPAWACIEPGSVGCYFGEAAR